MNLILVHGAFQGGWIWDRILPKLRMAGYEVFCPTLAGLGERRAELTPNIGLTDHIHDICNVIDHNDLSNVVLIGHSYGGVVISGVAGQRANKICKLIYLDACIPENGESLLDILGPELATLFYTSAIEDGGGWQVKPFPPTAFGLTEKTDIDWVVSQNSSQSLKSFTDPVSVIKDGEAPHLMIGYIQCLPGNELTDRMVNLAQEKGWQNYQIQSQHSPMITHPDELVELLKRIITPTISQ